MKRIFGLLYLLVGIGLIMAWNFYLEDRVNTVVIVKAKTDIQKDEILSDANIMLVRENREKLISDVLTEENYQSLLGKEAAQYIPKNSQINASMIDFFGVVPNADQEIVAIKDDWIYSMPGSLRRKDRINIYLVEPEKNQYETYNSYSYGYNTEIQANDNSYEIQDDLQEDVSLDLEDYPMPIDEPILRDIVVAYAKDNANREVKSDEERLDATAIIGGLELVLNQEQRTLIKNYVLQGYKFWITY